MLAYYYRCMNTQTWLSLDGICNVLRTTRPHIQWLVKNNYLEMIPGHKPGFHNGRFLDPTPMYAERLRVAEMIYRRRNPLPADMDLSEKAIFTRAEIAAVLGWSEQYAVVYLKKKKVPAVKIGGGRTGGLKLYTAKTVRELLWRRNGRKTSAQRAPFLIQELIDWFLKHESAAAEGVPTDAAFAEDDLFQKKLRAILKMPEGQKQRAMRELWEKVELAKSAAAFLERTAEIA
jgi:hypothetical protein